MVQYIAHTILTGMHMSLLSACAASVCLQVGGCRGCVPGCWRSGLPPGPPPEACLQGVCWLQRDGWWAFSVHVHSLRVVYQCMQLSQTLEHGISFGLSMNYRSVLSKYILHTLCQWLCAVVQMVSSTGSLCICILWHPLQARSCTAWQRRLWKYSKG